MRVISLIQGASANPKGAAGMQPSTCGALKIAQASHP
jgi:hypothetical protein